MAKFRLSLIVPVLSIALAVTACSGGDRPAAERTPLAVAEGGSTPGMDLQQDELGLDSGSTLDANDDSIGRTESWLEGYAHLPADPEPTGPTTTIALVFMQRLQTEDWLGAARQLGLYGRNVLSLMKTRDAEAVMLDVAHNAGGARLGTCTSARRLHHDAAVVRCGRVDVVVHTTTYPWRGVLISAEHPKRDILSTPHTHAYTTHVQ